MELESLIESAAGNGASDLHLEAGMPAALRVRGALRVPGEPIRAQIPAGHGAGRSSAKSNGRFSWSGARLICPRRFAASAAGSIFCNTSRGVGLAIRLLSAVSGHG